MPIFEERSAQSPVGNAVGIFFFYSHSASLGWFAYAPEWYETKSKSFAQSEAHSVSSFVHHLLNERVDAVPTDLILKGRGRESELSSMVCMI